VILVVVLLTAAVLAYLISTRLQKLVTGPILKLTETMQFISQKGLYSLRAEKSTESEINTLVTSFNHMLDVIQQREERVRQSEAQFRAAFEMAAVGHVLVGREGQFLRVNGEICRLLGYTSQELLSMKFSDITFPDDMDQSTEIFQSLLSGAQGSYVFEKRFLTKNGEMLWVIISTAAIADAFGQVNSIISVVQDITERKRVEKERDRLLLTERQARLDAEKSVRVRDEFLSIASHELRTPIAPIKMHIELMRLEMEKLDPSIFPESSGLRRAIDISERQIENLEHLTQDLLDVSRITAGRIVLNRRRVDLRELITDVIERSQLLIHRSGSKVELKLPDPLIPVVGQWDPLRIEQIVMNLLTNALKYGQGKPIAIRFGLQESDATLQVEDQGIGIAPEDQERIFQRFERVASMRNYPGLGLGLYITRELVRAHGGRIQVESELGHGTRFTVFLPLTK
jgi:PAS domain S-box-containing protein